MMVNGPRARWGVHLSTCAPLRWMDIWKPSQLRHTESPRRSERTGCQTRRQQRGGTGHVDVMAKSGGVREMRGDGKNGVSETKQGTVDGR